MSNHFLYQGKQTAYLKSETRDPRLLAGPKTQEFGNHLASETRDPRPGTIKVGPKTHPRLRTFMIPGIWDSRPRTRKVRAEILMIIETRYLEHSSLLKPGTKELWSKWFMIEYIRYWVMNLNDLQSYCISCSRLTVVDLASYIVFFSIEIRKLVNYTLS